MKTLLFALLLLCCGFEAVMCGSAAQEDVSRIEVHCTPGKPMQLFDPTKPGESITVRRDGSRYELIVAVNVPRKGIETYTESSASVSREDWDRLVTLVQQNGLLRFKPDEEWWVQVADYASAGFTIEGSASNVQQWSKPIKNAAKPQALMRELAQLARQKIPRIELHYFSTP